MEQQQTEQQRALDAWRKHERRLKPAPIRLLRTDNFQLEEPTRDDKDQLPDYAILSHTWLKKENGQEQEVLFADFVDPGKASEKAGWKKVKFAAREAARDGLQYVWIDSCCIDKTSSAELSESINSMYRWYECASVCYVYLNDMPRSVTEHTVPKVKSLDLEAFKKCRWFTRGWTLQEMIASRRNTKFYNCAGELLGTLKCLAYNVAEITGVHEEMLSDSRKLSSFSVAQRMSWASNRQTTRVEDRAYSLLGIFALSLATAYGEGERAFARLQEEILRSGSDHTIFAWGYENDVDMVSDFSNLGFTISDLLARGPDAFKGPYCRRMTTAVHVQSDSQRKYEMATTSVEIDLYILNGSKKRPDQVAFDALLNCCFEDEPTRYIILRLVRLGSGTFCRRQVGSCDIYNAIQHSSQLSFKILRYAPEHFDRPFLPSWARPSSPMRLMFRCNRALQDSLEIRNGGCGLYSVTSSDADKPLSEYMLSHSMIGKDGCFLLSALEPNRDVAGSSERSYLAKGFVWLETRTTPVKSVHASFTTHATMFSCSQDFPHGVRVELLQNSKVETLFERRPTRQSKKARLVNYLISPANFVLDDFRVLTSREKKHSLLEYRFCLVEFDVQGRLHLLYLLLFERIWTLILAGIESISAKMRRPRRRWFEESHREWTESEPIKPIKPK